MYCISAILALIEKIIDLGKERFSKDYNALIKLNSN